jgi:MFS family permease
MKRVLALPTYRRLLVAYLFTQVATTVAALALSVLVYRRTGSALGATAFFICAEFVPGLIAPPLVARFDRVHPRRVLPVMYGIEALLFGVLAWFTAHFSLVPVLVLTVVDGALAFTVRSLTWASRTAVVRPLGLLREGNAVVNVGFSVVFMAGPLLGGAVVATGGTVAALILDCGLFAAVAIVLAATKLPLVAEPEDASILRRLREGLRQVRQDRLLPRLIGMQAVGLIFFSMTIPVEVVYAQHELHAGAGGYGTLLAVWGAGAVGGSMAYARWRQASSAVLLTASAGTLMVGFGIMAVAGNLAVAVIGAAIGGGANGVWAAASRTAIQERCPDRWLALTTTFADSTAALAPGLGILLGGVLAAIFSARAAFAAAAAGALLFAFIAPLVLRVAAGPPAGVASPTGAEPRTAAEQDRSFV